MRAALKGLSGSAWLVRLPVRPPSGRHPRRIHAGTRPLDASILSVDDSVDSFTGATIHHDHHV
ncbi:MAG: hypothetical protein QOJ71_3162 [Actinomycetota bacterium]|jgi:hypothetical protein|nr:hypothetical protein [Actinomycetota bacterium]